MDRVRNEYTGRAKITRDRGDPNRLALSASLRAPSLRRIGDVCFSYLLSRLVGLLPVRGLRNTTWRNASSSAASATPDVPHTLDDPALGHPFSQLSFSHQQPVHDGEAIPAGFYPTRALVRRPKPLRPKHQGVGPLLRVPGWLGNRLGTGVDIQGLGRQGQSRGAREKIRELCDCCDEQRTT